MIDLLVNNPALGVLERAKLTPEMFTKWLKTLSSGLLNVSKAFVYIIKFLKTFEKHSVKR